MKKLRLTMLMSIIAISMIIVCLVSCGPSKAERDALNQIEMRHVTIATDNCGCNSYTATYYDADGCEYVGHLNNSPSDFMAHSGQCKHCEKRNAFILDSLIKENLKEFFTVHK